ncbi:topoisomerase DNA-binding C4 zinc finger domain-containing protein [Epilithonimonas xixisoli]|uniref:Topoisomerase-like DNA binding C4 zinc finger protein n=1 Tax=Epilithonimonas xixisoli TaxID=1476462 RepID=A0A4V3H2G8_9FLAO|nr:topoisomerase DNA-binding C4 zinc finger domain-containing protein [Epilithonimonas xixisoli]TDX83946.1 topoisomerase-like DNA binding C4 zinc finger protein [Epilithonimonas xixisoli]
MSLPDGAEYWQKNSFHLPNTFRHAKGVECVHNHNTETEYINDVECRACLKIIEEKRPENLMDGDAPEFYYYSKTYAKKMRKAKKEREEFNDKYGVCDCGCDWRIRLNKSNSQEFLGCSNYPKCKKTKSILKINNEKIPKTNQH